MSKNGSLTREQAIALVGEAAVNAVDQLEREPSGRQGFNGAKAGDEFTEWNATLDCKQLSGHDVTLIAHYYTTNEQDDSLESVDWVVEGYKVI